MSRYDELVKKYQTEAEDPRARTLEEFEYLRIYVERMRRKASEAVATQKEQGASE